MYTFTTNSLRNLRLALGLTQVEMALLLGINRSLLAMSELFQRTLNTGNEKIHAFEKALSSDTKLGKELQLKFNAMHEDSKLAWSRAIDKEEQKLHQLKKRLENMKRAYTRARNILTIINNETLDRTGFEVLEKKRRQSEKSLLKNCPGNQLNLEMEIELVKAIIKFRKESQRGE